MSIFLVNSDYNTYLFNNNQFILPTKYKYVKLEDIPTELIYSLLWSEDREFFEHNGINIKALTRAALINIRHLSIVQGGSTITQQLSKTVYLSNERNVKRKIMDMMLAFFLERSYTKEEILEAYLNSVYLGNDISGIGAAAQRYFGKDVQDLSTEEILVLVGIINGPEIYNPYKYPDRAKSQAEILLYSLPDNFFSLQTREDIDKKIHELIFYPQSYNERYLNLIYRVKQEEELIGLKGGGYTIKTTYNKNLFDSVTLDENSSAIVLNNKTGEILSFWGGEYTVFYSNQQIGSSIKPFYYILALEKGYDVNTVLPDYSMKFGDWAPQNYDKTYRGSVTLKEALVNSINIPSIYLAMHIDISPQQSIDTIKDFLLNELGIQGVYPNDLTLSLGTLETSPYELAKAYSIFPNYGIIPSTYTISEVYDRKGNLIYKRYPQIERKVKSISNKSYSIMNSMLREVVTNGTGKRANIPDLDLHGKTGTSDTSAWFVGFTGGHVFSVLVEGEDILSSTSAVPISKDIATSLLYLSSSKEVPVYISLDTTEKKDSFFDAPIEFISKGKNVIEFLNSIKYELPINELKRKINEAINVIEYIYPDIVISVRKWEEENLIDFLKDPVAFIQNGFDLDTYLSELTINETNISKLKKAYVQLLYIYPDQALIVEKFLKENGLF
ncbi:MAG: transglycosylase domain-containing protein [Defluviitoga tunisiensis]|jgi:membrane peptidoglycan carboxypeptidase